MESYKALSEEVDRLDHSVKYSREQESSSQMELNTLNKEKHQFEELCRQQAAEIEQVRYMYGIPPTRSLIRTYHD